MGLTGPDLRQAEATSLAQRRAKKPLIAFYYTRTRPCETACNRQVFNKKEIFLFAGLLQAKYAKGRQIDGLKIYAALPLGILRLALGAATCLVEKKQKRKIRVVRLSYSHLPLWIFG